MSKIDRSGLVKNVKKEGKSELMGLGKTSQKNQNKVNCVVNLEGGGDSGQCNKNTRTNIINFHNIEDYNRMRISNNTKFRERQSRLSQHSDIKYDNLLI